MLLPPPPPRRNSEGGCPKNFGYADGRLSEMLMANVNSTSNKKKFAAKKSAIHRAAKSNYVGEIATALAELYDKEKQRIKLLKWQFVAECMAKYLPQEYQPHESSDAPQAWKRLVLRHKRSD